MTADTRWTDEEIARLRAENHAPLVPNMIGPREEAMAALCAVESVREQVTTATGIRGSLLGKGGF